MLYMNWDYEMFFCFVLFIAPGNGEIDHPRLFLRRRPQSVILPLDFGNGLSAFEGQADSSHM